MSTCETCGPNLPTSCDCEYYADDLAALVEALDLKDAIHVGHSTGGGEVTRYIGRQGSKRVAKAVLISAVPPLLLKTEANPNGLPIEFIDQLRAGVLADRNQFMTDFRIPFFGFNRPGAKVSQGLLDSFLFQSRLASLPATYECIKAFAQTDFTDERTIHARSLPHRRDAPDDDVRQLRS